MNRRVIPRTVTALVGIPLLILIIGWGEPWHFVFLVSVTTAVALYEYFSMVFPGDSVRRTAGILLGALVALGIVVPEFREAGLGLVFVITVAFAFCLFSGSRVGGGTAEIGWMCLGALYLGYLVPHFILLYRLPSGSHWIFWLLTVIMAGDTAAYFVGSLFGKRKLAPEISPGKTVEGAWASTAASLSAGIVAGWFLLPQVGSAESAVLAVVLSLLGQVGDLFESWIKRRFSVKDSGAILPGHGGLLDRIDSLIFPVVLTAYYVQLFHS